MILLNPNTNPSYDVLYIAVNKVTIVFWIIVFSQIINNKLIMINNKYLITFP